jgi:hypothetical protein
MTEITAFGIVIGEVRRACRHALDLSLDLGVTFPAFLGARIEFPVMAAWHIEGYHCNYCNDNCAEYHYEQEMKPCNSHLNYPLNQWHAN